MTTTQFIRTASGTKSVVPITTPKFGVPTDLIFGRAC